VRPKKRGLNFRKEAYERRLSHIEKKKGRVVFVDHLWAYLSVGGRQQRAKKNEGGKELISIRPL